MHDLQHALKCGVQNILIKVGFRDRQEAAVAMCAYREDERLSCENGQMTHHLSRVWHKQTCFFLSVNQPLIHVQSSGNHKKHTGVLLKMRSCNVQLKGIWSLRNGRGGRSDLSTWSPSLATTDPALTCLRVTLSSRRLGSCRTNKDNI